MWPATKGHFPIGTSSTNWHLLQVCHGSSFSPVKNGHFEDCTPGCPGTPSSLAFPRPNPKSRVTSTSASSSEEQKIRSPGGACATVSKHRAVEEKLRCFTEGGATGQGTPKFVKIPR